MIIRLFIFLAILLMPVLSYGMECYQSGQSVPFDGYFHDDTGTLFDPTSPTAVLRITPFTGTSTYCDNTAGTDPCTGTDEGTLPAPTKLNLETGRYGGEYIIGSAAVEGTREITVKGTVPSARTTGKVVSIFQVRNTCPTSILVVTDNIGLNLDDTSGTLSDAEIETIIVTAGTVSDKSGYSLASGGFPVGGFASGAITADAIATDAIGALEIAAGAIGASEVAEYSGSVVSSADCTNSTTVFDTGLTSTLPDRWKDMWLTFKIDTATAELRGQTKAITASSTNGCVTVKGGYNSVPVATPTADTFMLVNK